MTIEEILKTHDEIGFKDNLKCGDMGVYIGDCGWRYFRPKPPKPLQGWINKFDIIRCDPNDEDYIKIRQIL